MIHLYLKGEKVKGILFMLQRYSFSDPFPLPNPLLQTLNPPVEEKNYPSLFFREMGSSSPETIIVSFVFDVT